MKKFIYMVGCFFLCTALSGCSLVEGAFKAGFIIALILVAIVGVLVWILHYTYVHMARRFPAIHTYIDDLLNG